jgi:hypothetical protein
MADEKVKLNRKLNLVLKIEAERGTLHVFSTPIGRAVFEDNFLIMGRAFASIFNNALSISGPKMAALLIRHEAEIIDEREKGEALILEIKRLTNVLTPTANGAGYETMPYVSAVSRKLIDEDDAADIEGRICFFTLALRVGSERQIEASLTALKGFWKAETTLLTLLDYQRSLTTSTPIAATGPNATPQPEIQPLSIPS